MKNISKKSQIMSLFWSAILIFIIFIQSVIGFMMIAQRNIGSSNIVINSDNFVTDIYGPVIPIILEADYDFYISLLKESDLEILVYNKFSTIQGFKSISTEIINSKSNDLGFNVNGDLYREVFYIQRQDSEYVKIVLEITLS